MPQFLKDRLRDTAIIMGAAAALTFFGVYTTDGPLWVRYLMWLVTITVGGITSRFAIPLVFERRIAGEFMAVQSIVAAAIIALPVLVSLYLFIGFFGNWMPARDLPLQYIYVFAIALGLTLIGVLINRAQRPHAGATPDADTLVRFMDRLPVRYRGADLWALSSEDHYLRVHTSRGEELILMRLADAVRELSGADGVQVHRSWWVAKDGVADTRREAGKVLLVLQSGSEVPVSRTYLPAAREAGLV